MSENRYKVQTWVRKHRRPFEMLAEAQHRREVALDEFRQELHGHARGDVLHETARSISDASSALDAAADAMRAMPEVPDRDAADALQAFILAAERSAALTAGFTEVASTDEIVEILEGWSAASDAMADARDKFDEQLANAS